MINFDIEHPSRSLSLIEADKKSIRIESVSIIVIGSFYLLLFFKIINPDYSLSYIPISILYITTGISGCICLRNNSSGFQTIYKVLIIALIIAKVILIVFAIIFIVVLILNPVKCSKSKSDMCGVGVVAWLFLLILTVVLMTVFLSTLSLFFVMLKHLKKYQDDIRSLGFIHFT